MGRGSLPPRRLAVIWIILYFVIGIITGVAVLSKRGERDFEWALTWFCLSVIFWPLVVFQWSKV